MNDVMIDLETLGTTSRSAIITIGAVKFSRHTGKIDSTPFYEHIDWTSAMRSRHVDGNTLKWWMVQNEQARKEITRLGKPVKQVLTEFSQWFPTSAMVWGNGSCFDISMMEDMMNQYGIEIPWKYWNVRDMRTIKALFNAKELTLSHKPTGVAHNAIDDATNQAKQTAEMWQALTTTNDLFD